MVAEEHMLTCWKVLDRRANQAPRAFYMAWLLERAEDSVKTKREIQGIGRSLQLSFGDFEAFDSFFSPC